MAYPIRQLIIEAYYLSGLVSRETETVSGEELEEGRHYLNIILSNNTINGERIIYSQSTKGTLNISSNTIYVPKLFCVQTITLYNGNIRYPLTRLDRDQFYGTSSIHALESIPVYYHEELSILPLDLTENQPTEGMRINVYPCANTNYEYVIHGKFGFDEIKPENLSDDALKLWAYYYINYLTLSLAKRLNATTDIAFPVATQELLKSVEQELCSKNTKDYSMKIMNPFGFNESSSCFPLVNLGTGYIP